MPERSFLALGSVSPTKSINRKSFFAKYKYNGIPISICTDFPAERYISESKRRRLLPTISLANLAWNHAHLHLA